MCIWGFPKIRGPFLVALTIRALLLWGPYWGPLILRNYHIVHKTGAPQRACLIWYTKIQDVALRLFLVVRKEAVLLGCTKYRSQNRSTEEMAVERVLKAGVGSIAKLGD